MTQTPVTTELVELNAVEWWTPQNLEEAKHLAKIISESSLVPKDYVGKPSNVMVAMIYGQQLGLGPLPAMQNIAVINGRPKLWGDAVAALVRSRSDLELFEESEMRKGDELVGWRCTIKRKNQSPVARSFTVEEAKTARLWGKEGPWQTYPSRMLQMRARSFAVRDAYPDALMGLGLVEDDHEEDVVKANAVVVEPRPSPEKPDEDSTHAAEDAVIETPRDPKTWEQKAPPKRAKVGDEWLCPDGAVGHAIVVYGNLYWVFLDCKPATKVPNGTLVYQFSEWFKVDGQELARIDAVPEEALALLDAPDDEPEDDDTNEEHTEESDIALAQARQRVKDLAREHRITSSSIMEMASEIVGEEVFAMSSLTVEQLRELIAKIEQEVA